jgi:hypothetical protein
MTMDLMSEIASDDVLEQAFAWSCGRRCDYSLGQEVCNVRWRWHDMKPQVLQLPLQGLNRLGPVRRFGDGADPVEVWDARDALVRMLMS